jgi:ABC-2 type transport system permease protein
MRSILVMASKDLLLLWRDRFGLFWVAVFPLMFAVFFGSIFSSGGDDDSPKAIKIALVDMDSTGWSIEFIAEIDSSESFTTVHTGLDDAVDLVRKGKVTGYVVLEEGFGEYPGPFFGGSPPLQIGVDPSRRAEAGYIQGIITKMLFTSFQKRMMNRDKMTENMGAAIEDVAAANDLDSNQKSTLMSFLESVKTFYDRADSTILGTDRGEAMGEINVETVEKERPEGSSPRSAYDISFPQAILWGLIGCAASFAISIVSERTTGTLLRLRLAPVSRVHVLAGKGLACFISCISVMIVLLAFGKFAFGVNTSNTVQLAMSVIASSLCFVGIMMFMSVLGRTERAVAGSGWSILMVMAMLGGAMVPAMIMPSWMKALSNVSPVRWAIYSMEGAVWRDFTVNEMLMPVLILLGVGCLFFAVGSVIMCRSDF